MIAGRYGQAQRREQAGTQRTAGRQAGRHVRTQQRQQAGAQWRGQAQQQWYSGARQSSRSEGEDECVVEDVRKAIVPALDDFEGQNSEPQVNSAQALIEPVHPR